MEQLKFREKMEGMMIDCVSRNDGYTMAVKHMHQEYEVYLLLEGEQYYFIEEKVYHVSPGDIMLIGKEKIHWTGIADCPKQERIVLSIREEWLTPFLEQNGMWGLSKLFQNAQRIRPEEQQFVQIHRLLLELKEEVRQKRIGYETMVKMKLSQVFLLLLREQQKRVTLKEQQKTEKYQLACKAIAYIQAHCHRKLLLQEVAEALYISRSYLTRIFKEITGATVNEYIAIQRIQMGKRLLAESKESITRVAEECGFESITYFERVFKQYTEKTPREYRHQVKRLIEQ